MLQLHLLSRVVPAFVALALEGMDDPELSLARDAEDCYAALVGIGLAVSISHGEWSHHLKDVTVRRLLAALDSRLPKKRVLFSFSMTGVDKPGNTNEFSRLRVLSQQINSLGLDSFDECGKLPNQTLNTCGHYLSIIRPRITLFHEKERRSKEVRSKFLRRVNEASIHLLDVYVRNDIGADAEGLCLSQHPSHGSKDLANRVYRLLESHWGCAHTPRREARLSLIQNRHFALKISRQEEMNRRQRPTKLEVLLPVPKDRIEWKVTNVEEKMYHHVVTEPEAVLVDNNINLWLSRSTTGFQVDFLACTDRLWHLRPTLRTGSVDCHTTMDSLHHLLGDGVSASDIAKYSPREKLTLCYILATSFLYLYPGTWLHQSWSSANVYFVRRHGNPASPVLTFPYLSVELQETGGDQNPVRDHMQCHTHPTILALGIIFLEIATGVRFVRTASMSTQWEQINSDCKKAVEQLDALEEQGISNPSKRLPSKLREAIRSCLKLEPPATLLSNSLAEEGPVRHYILSCIVGPLAIELRDGYKVSLENLHEAIVPDKHVDWRSRESSSQQTTSLKAPDNGQAPAGEAVLPFHNATFFAEAKGFRDPQVTEIHLPDDKRLEICLLADGRSGEVQVDENRKSVAKQWLQFHNDALARITSELRKPLPYHSRIRIAILDSGIDLSDNNLRAIYGSDFGSSSTPSIVYRNWVDDNQDWKDDVGHGTHLVGVLRQAAPDAVIHVARVFKKRPNTATSERIISEALRYAVDEWKVDIVVMSFGLGRESDLLSRAIDHATAKKVLMFAAASNDGRNRPGGVAWPASKTGVFCVHSADGHGNPSSFTPNPREGMRIMVLGECVKSAWPPRFKATGNHKLMSGTSCAAPIAAGIAAVILDYSRGFLSREEWERLRTYDSMRRMFEELSDRDSHSGYWWIKHWALFSPDRGEPWIQGEIQGFSNWAST